MSETLADALPREIERVQDLIPIYESVPMGHLAAVMMRNSIKEAHQAMVGGDVVGMLSSLKDLQGYDL